jgi:hypothetical protein
MPNIELDDSVTEESWQKARDADEGEGCAGGVVHEQGGPNCRRGADCRCARRIGAPIPVAANRPHDAGR